MNKIDSKNEIKYMNVIKGLAIISVVIGHTSSPLMNYIYMYHLPLFFFVSGYFYKEEYSLNPLKLIKKRLRTLYLPFIKYELIFLILHNLFFKLNIYNNRIKLFNLYYNTTYSTVDFVKKAISILLFKGTEIFLNPFWFITCLFIVNIFFCIISFIILKLFKNDREQIRFLVMFICLLFGVLMSKKIVLPTILNAFYINQAIVALPIYYLGFIYRKIEKNISFNIYVTIGSICCLLVNANYGSVGMSGNYYDSPSFFLISSLAGIYINIYIAKFILNKLEHSYLCNLIQFAGKNTIIILSLHILSFKLIDFIQIRMYNLSGNLIEQYPTINSNGLWWLIYSLVGIAVPCFVAISINFLKNKLSLKNKLEFRN